MQRMRHANSGRLLLRTPGPVPLWDLHVFKCRDQSLLNLSCLRTFELLLFCLLYQKCYKMQLLRLSSAENLNLPTPGDRRAIKWTHN